MKLKIITLNTWLFEYFDEINDFIKSENPDVILLQEVTSGLDKQIPHGITNGYEKLRDQLLDYESCFMPMRRYVNNEFNMWFGHSIFSKYPIVNNSSQFYLDTFQTVESVSFVNTIFPGLLLSSILDLGSIKFEVLTTHFIWSMHPEINDRQRQAVSNLMKILELKENFIIGGDFNITDDSEIYISLSKNLIDDRPLNTKRTIHPTIHKVGSQKELAVDYLFHKGDKIKLIKSEVPIVPISDHLPIVAEYELG